MRPGSITSNVLAQPDKINPAISHTNKRSIISPLLSLVDFIRPSKGKLLPVALAFALKDFE